MDNKITSPICYDLTVGDHGYPAPTAIAHLYAGELSNRGNPLATIFMGGPGALHNDKETIEQMARLFSAAPDLLVALEAAIPYLEEAAGEDHSHTETLESARAAIKKAKGE